MLVIPPPQRKRPKQPARPLVFAPPANVNVTHIFAGEINKRGKPTGFHSRPGGQDPATARLVRIVDRPNRAGVYTAEVENCLAQHAAVAQCAVFGIPDERWGEAVHAVVMKRSGADVSETALIDFCREHIAHYKCPRSVKIQDEMLPLSGAGKILKRELRKPYWEGKGRAVN